MRDGPKNEKFIFTKTPNTIIMKGVILSLVLVVMLSTIVVGIKNPSAIYCEELGFEYEKVISSDGSQTGYCIVKDQKFNAWDFFQGKVGENYSYCAEQGYDIEVRDDGESSYAQEYAVCVNSSEDSGTMTTSGSTSDSDDDKTSDEEEIPQEELMGLDEKLQDGTDEEEEEQTESQQSESQNLESQDLFEEEQNQEESKNIQESTSDETIEENDSQEEIESEKDNDTNEEVTEDSNQSSQEKNNINDNKDEGYLESFIVVGANVFLVLVIITFIYKRREIIK